MRSHEKKRDSARGIARDVKYGAAAVRMDSIAARARIVRETEHAVGGKAEMK